MTGFIFNIDGGYLEGLCRGFKCGILKQTDYLNLVQCETLEGESKLLFILALSSEGFSCLNFDLKREESPDI